MLRVVQVRVDPEDLREAERVAARWGCGVDRVLRLALVEGLRVLRRGDGQAQPVGRLIAGHKQEQ